MPSVLDAPELLEYVDTHALTPHGLTIEQPQPRRARPGFWRTLVHGLTQHLTPTSCASQASTYSGPRPFEAPIDRLLREYPSLAPLVLCIL
jgi:hypothetical protein